MSKLTVAANIAQQKTMLAEKYDRLAASISSKPRRKRYQRQAAIYRRQAASFAHKAEAK
ncbi:MAG TPA: hypothetical protein VG433_13090 [Pirellulales bacterium]|nr:hypothetical protein [Pirellulales bacterium]